MESKVVTAPDKREVASKDFSTRLIETFKILRKYNVDTLGTFLDSVKDMNEERLRKLDRELCIWYTFMFLHHCRQIVKDAYRSAEAIKVFYDYLEGEVLDKSAMKVSVQDKIMIRFKPYSDALEKSDPTWYLSKELGKNILGEQYKTIEIMISLGNYIDYISNQIKDIVIRVLENH